MSNYVDAEDRRDCDVYYDPTRWKSLRDQLQTTADEAAIREVTGISDRELLDALAKLDIELESLATITLLPMMTVAWASGRVEPGEREYIVNASRALVEQNTSLKSRLIEAWTVRRPSPSMFRAWRACVSELLDQLPVSLRHRFADHILDESAQVAAAAGGLFGFGVTCREEEDAIARIEAIVRAYVEDPFGA